VLVVGDVDTDTTMSTIHDLFSDLQAPNTVRPRAATTISFPDAIRCTSLTDPETVHTEVALQVQIPCTEGHTEREYISQHLLPGLVQRILNERFSELSRTENPPFIHASATRHRVSPDLIHHAVAARIHGGQITTGTVALSHAVERLRQVEVDKSALERAARRMIRDFKHLEVEDARLPSARLINELVRHHNVGEPMPGAAVERRIAERLVSDIDLDLVRTACAEWFPENGRILTIVGPAKSKLPSREAALSMLDTPLPPRAPTRDAQQLRRLMSPATSSGDIADTRSWPKLDLTCWTLSNGARIWLKPTPHKADEIQLYAQVSGGLSMADDATYVAARTALSITQRSGLGDHDATTLSRFLAGRTVGLRAVMQEHWHGLRGSSNRADFDTLLELVALQITAPRFDLTAFENERAAREAALKNRKADPAAVFRGRFKRRLWKEHPRMKPWKLSDLNNMSLDTSSDFYSDAMAGLAQGDVLIVGSFDLKGIQETICRRIGTLPTAAQATQWMDRNRRAITGPERLLVERGQTPRSTVRIRFGGDSADSPESRYAIRSMSAVLSLMLRAELREARGGTYNVSVRTSTVQRPVPFWAMTIQFDCEPARSEALIQAALDTVDRLCDGDIPPHFVDEVRAQHTRGREQSLVKNGFWVNALALAIRRQEDPMEITHHKARINALDLAGVITTAQAKLSKAPQLIGVLQPEAQTT
jgi:zinc protease